ncbi:MAG: hypothetical protein HWE16_12925 [Gammaproteobacteria bacterium]|nr:hypothetical protein [Gammaproteobacteria bacterium]
MRYFYLALVSLVLFSGCASVDPSQVDRKLASWQGSNISTLVQIWGLPSNEREIQGIKYAEWNSREIKNRPAVNIGVGGFGSRIFGSIGTTIFGGQKESHCLVQVGYKEDGTVITSNWQGDADTCNDSIPEKE